MSYILDALKKSEKERRKGSVPDIESLQDALAEKPRKRIIWPYILAGALFINAAIFVIWITFPLEDKVVPVDTATTKPAKPEAPVAPALSLAPETTPEAIAMPEETDPMQNEGVAEEPGNPAAPAPESSLREPTAIGKKVQEEKPPLSLQKQQTGNIITEKIEPARPRTIDLFTTSERKVETESEEQSPILTLQRLPSAIADALPDLVIAAHFYSVNPSSRMASINGKIRREGQQVETGLTVHEITPEGVIFRFRGRLFRINVFDK